MPPMTFSSSRACCFILTGLPSSVHVCGMLPSLNFAVRVQWRRIFLYLQRAEPARSAFNKCFYPFFVHVPSAFPCPLSLLSLVADLQGPNSRPCPPGPSRPCPEKSKNESYTLHPYHPIPESGSALGVCRLGRQPRQTVDKL